MIIKKITALIFLLFYLDNASATMPVFDYSAWITLGSQLNVLKQQTQFIAKELKQLKGNQYEWSNAQTLINNLGNIIEQKNGISYSASNIDEQFKKAYPGYVAPADFSKEYKENSENTLNTLNGVMQSMGKSASDFQNENRRLSFLQQQSQSAEGQTQAIQALAQLASEMVSQIQLLRQTMIAQTNAQSAYYANEIQNDAYARSELENVINAGSTQFKPYGSGHALNPPEFT